MCTNDEQNRSFDFLYDIRGVDNEQKEKMTCEDFQSSPQEKMTMIGDIRSVK